MSQAEALKLQLDTLQREKERLEAENVRFREDHSEGAETEVQSLREKLEAYERKEQKWEDTATQLRATIDQMKMTAELERLRALAAEHGKWEAREERLVQQVQELKEKLKATDQAHAASDTPTPTRGPSSHPSLTQEADVKSEAVSGTATPPHDCVYPS